MRPNLVWPYDAAVRCVKPASRRAAGAALGLALLCGNVASFGQAASLPPGTSGAQDAADGPHQTSVSESVAASPLSAAETTLAAGDYTGAQAILTPYLRLHPQDARALFDLGYTMDATNVDGEAESEYRKAIAADPRQFESHMALGLLLANEKKTVQAIAMLKEAAQLTPVPANPAAQGQANRTLARLLEPTDPAAARIALIAALRESPETPADSLLAGDIAAREGDSDTAANAYGKVLSSAAEGSADRAQAAAGLAHLLLVEKRYPEAEAVLHKALADDAQNPVLNTELGDALSAEGKLPEAIAVVESLHARVPGDSNVTSVLADLYTQTGALTKALPLYQQLLLLHPHDASLLASTGDALVRSDEPAEAIPVLQEATRLNPSNGDAWSSLAFAANQTHQPQMVLDALAMRSKVMSETPATYFLAATAWDTLRETKRAVALYRQFLAVAGTGFPDEVWQAKHRLVALAR
jgi:tetratricopeptide (TPR) repeat protein